MALKDYSTEELRSELKRREEVETAQKVESKFHVCDCIARNRGVHYFLRVVEVHLTAYVLEDVQGHRGTLGLVYTENHYHLWTIDDAKDGDVLVYTDGTLAIFHFRLTGLNAGLYMSHVLLTDKIVFKQICAVANVSLATKEQRVFLFEELHKAGYEWSEETHELKRL